MHLVCYRSLPLVIRYRHPHLVPPQSACSTGLCLLLQPHTSVHGILFLLRLHHSAQPFCIHVLQDSILFQELGLTHRICVYKLIYGLSLRLQEVPNHMQQVTEGKGDSLLLFSISSRCSELSVCVAVVNQW